MIHDPVRTVGSMLVRELGEFAVITRLLAEASSILPKTAQRDPAKQGTVEVGFIGPGDDCATVPMTRLHGSNGIAVTTDVMVAGRHFAWEFSSPADIGWKLLAVNLSDLAAVGATPIGGTLTLQVPGDLPMDHLLGLARGIVELGNQFGFFLLGGDTTEACECSFGMTVFGALVGEPIGRAGARVGDDLWVSGTIGGGGGGLRWCRDQSGKSPGGSLVDPHVETESLRSALAVDRYRRPLPRINLGQWLAADKIATAAIDVSDGLIQDVGHIADRSGVSVEIVEADVPLTPGVRELGLTISEALTAGDDYEILFTAPESQRDRITEHGAKEARCAVTRIGKILPLARGHEGQHPTVWIITENGRTAAAAYAPHGGYAHFRSER